MASWRTNDATVTFLSRPAGWSAFGNPCMASDKTAVRARAALASHCVVPCALGLFTVEPKRRRRCALPS